MKYALQALAKVSNKLLIYSSQGNKNKSQHLATHDKQG
jgi:hypothetical protein